MGRRELLLQLAANLGKGKWMRGRAHLRRLVKQGKTIAPLRLKDGKLTLVVHYEHPLYVAYHGLLAVANSDTVLQQRMPTQMGRPTAVEPRHAASVYLTHRELREIGRAARLVEVNKLSVFMRQSVLLRVASILGRSDD